MRARTGAQSSMQLGRLVVELIQYLPDACFSAVGIS